MSTATTTTTTTAMTDADLLAIAGPIPRDFTQLGIDRELLPALRRAVAGDIGRPLADSEYMIPSAVWQKHAIIRVAEAAGYRVIEKAGRARVVSQF